MNLLLVLIFAISLLPTEGNAAKCRLYHKVKPGESLWSVADRYNMYIEDILRANPKLDKKKFLRVGQRLCIPYKGRSPQKKSSPTNYTIYVVKRGDSLKEIAQKFGVNWRDIKAANRLRSNTIFVGQKLKIPTSEEKSAETSKTYRRGEVVYIKYRVRRGDSLQRIAQKFGVNWRDIKAANRLRSDVIRVGQLIKVPVPKKAFERKYIDKPKIDIAFLPVDGKVEEGSRGVDIYASCGEKVRAVDSGKVIYSGDDLSTYGNMVIVEHAGYLSIYAYNMQNLVDRGDNVAKGEVIGKVGLKPGSGKCALHFEVRTKDGAVLNPLEYLGKK
ncbi:murein DD-endopeptidase MepM/ murein hydrolase activator NlpD [Hydrogenivirga caldilitoris]|uniref:Murein DD-endopeptidase MepM/ murein hydrolase activator NlpD n=1 Tax=Hydrogenivirga caldilitoris TaxID=246264 RepID=A0A497XR08_9AQUI|nr:M23 family metallopeptidase [Hydrogenivirga caldilitoris]RLJ71437.1 murein DD-endopeptidase MepM/ murein hydrolase activator NlpD [Hydrogenivirga caldilitoris]